MATSIQPYYGRRPTQPVVSGHYDATFHGTITERTLARKASHVRRVSKGTCGCAEEASTAGRAKIIRLYSAWFHLVPFNDIFIRPAPSLSSCRSLSSITLRDCTLILSIVCCCIHYSQWPVSAPRCKESPFHLRNPRVTTDPIIENASLLYWECERNTQSTGDSVAVHRQHQRCASIATCIS